MKYYWLIYLLIVGNITAFAQLIKVNSDTWSATDALGRKVCEYQDVGEKKKDKYVAMFYWTWHQGVDDTTYTVKTYRKLYVNIQRLWLHMIIQLGVIKTWFFYWEEPLFGYYRTTDTWVLRKHAEMLADAGIDVVFLIVQMEV